MAAFLVIVNHTNSRLFLGTQPSALWFGSISYFFVSKTAVPVFIMIMGAVLLEKQDSLKKYISRILRISVVTAIFSLVSYRVFVGKLSAKIVVNEIIGSSNEPYWYLYLYIGLLIVLPVMQAMAKHMGKREMHILLFATLAVGGFVPMLEFVGLRVHEAFFYGMLSPYIGMVFAGHYIEKHMDITAGKAVLAAFVFAALTAVQVLVSLKSYSTRGADDYLWLDNVKFVPITVSAICLYIIVKFVTEKVKVSSKAASVLCYTGSLTFGIYLMGEFFKAICGPLYTVLDVALPAMVAMVIFEIAIFITAALATAVIKLIPVLKKLI